MNTESNLLAKCPKCGSVFRLTLQHLQAAKGWMQCGMCGNVFHCGIQPPAEAAAQPRPAIPAKAPAEKAATTPAGSPDAAVGASAATNRTETVGPSGLAQRMADEQGAPSAVRPKLESIILIDPNLPSADEDYGPMPTIEPLPDEAKPEKLAVAPAPPPAGGWGARAASATSTGWIPRHPPPAPVIKPAKKRRLGWLWALLIILLLLTLAAQLIYSLRDRLAASHPGLRPQLAAACEVLGCSLRLPRDTRQVRILGSDLQAGNDGNLSLEVTLVNRASYPMAWPVLELTLTDVEDQPLARRLFAPSEYLPSSSLEVAGIPGRSEVPLSLQLQSKGIRAAGYRLRMFY